MKRCSNELQGTNIFTHVWNVVLKYFFMEVLMLETAAAGDLVFSSWLHFISIIFMFIFLCFWFSVRKMELFLLGLCKVFASIKGGQMPGTFVHKWWLLKQKTAWWLKTSTAVMRELLRSWQFLIYWPSLASTLTFGQNRFKLPAAVMVFLCWAAGFSLKDKVSSITKEEVRVELLLLGSAQVDQTFDYDASWVPCLKVC